MIILKAPVKTRTETFHVQGIPMVTVYDPSTKDEGYIIDEINGLPEDWIQDWIVSSVREQIAVHECELKHYQREMQDEARGDELYRGN